LISVSRICDLLVRFKSSQSSRPHASCIAPIPRHESMFQSSSHAQDCVRSTRDSRLMLCLFPATERARAHGACNVHCEHAYPSTHLLESNAPSISVPLFPCQPPPPDAHLVNRLTCMLKAVSFFRIFSAQLSFSSTTALRQTV
jgi:hypothetical protein